MKKLILICLPLVFLLSGCNRCGKNVDLGNFKLMTDTRADWYPYQGVNTLTFSNASGELISLSPEVREETMMYKSFRQTCTKGWADTAEEFYKGEWLLVHYRGVSNNISYRLEIIVSVEHIFNSPSLVLYDRASYGSFVSGDSGTAVAGGVDIIASKRGNSFNHADITEFNYSDFTQEIEINGKTYRDVWYFDRQGTPSIYVQQGYGIIAFAGLNNEVWLLKP